MKKKCWNMRGLALGCIFLLTAGGILTGCQEEKTIRKAEHLTEPYQTDALGTGDSQMGPVDEGSSSMAAVNRFSLDLFRESLDTNNPVLSPVSAYLALGMVSAGAKGETLEEFERVLGADITSNAGALMGSLPVNEETAVVTVANSVWIDDNMIPEEAWLQTVGQSFAGEVYRANLPEATKDINSWVYNQTQGLIPTMLSAPLPEDVRVTLLNAVYFKAKWWEPFEADWTKAEDFTLADGSVVQTDMMNSYYRTAPYMKADGMEAVALPYIQCDYEFVALKSTGAWDIRQVCEGLTAEKLTALMDSRQETLINLKLPKFTVSFDKKFSPPEDDLTNLGLESAFDPERADFSDMGSGDRGEPIYISNVQQKAIIIVDEKGTEAAAVTRADGAAGAAAPMEEPIDVFFDEPFLYMIRDVQTGTILFLGILDEPGE